MLDPKHVTVVQTRLLTRQSQDSNYCSIRLALDRPTTIAQDNSFQLVLELRNIMERRPSLRATVSLRSGFTQVLQHTVSGTNDDSGKRCSNVHTITSRDSSPTTMLSTNYGKLWASDYILCLVYDRRLCRSEHASNPEISAMMCTNLPTGFVASLIFQRRSSFRIR